MPDIRVTLSPDLHKRLKFAAADAEVPVKQMVVTMLQIALKEVHLQPKKG